MLRNCISIFSSVLEIVSSVHNVVTGVMSHTFSPHVSSKKMTFKKNEKRDSFLTTLNTALFLILYSDVFVKENGQ